MTTGHGAPNPVKSRIANSMGKARILMEALPYIKAFRGKMVVVKYGGSAMEDPDLQHSFAGDVTMLAMVGLRPVVVHGGGPQISEALRREGLDPQWIDGLRVTDPSTMRVVQRTLAGEINPDIVRLLNGHGCQAVGVTGLDADLLVALPKDPRLGLVGEVATVNHRLITEMVERGLVPVVAPLGRGEDGKVYNLNADTAAGALAASLGAQKLVYLTDIEGVRAVADDPGSVISRITVERLQGLMASGAVQGGMIPKLDSCATALGAGVGQAHILDGRIQHALLLEIFTPEGIGTMVVP
jgi:acetylglutamate kinase